MIAINSDYAIAIELLTDFHLIVNSMEQQRARPSDNQEQKSIFQLRTSSTHLKISLSSYQKEKILSV
jgi:hypothetical protein